MFTLEFGLSKYLIYMLTNTINGKIYIGASGNLANRLDLHSRSGNVNRRNKLGPILARAIQKYGWSAFRCDVIACSRTRDDMYLTEAALIAQHNATSMAKGYNTSAGGPGPAGVTKSFAQRLKLSQQTKGRPQSPGTKDALAKTNAARAAAATAVLTPEGRFASAKEAAIHFGIQHTTACARAAKGIYGWSYEGGSPSRVPGEVKAIVTPEGMFRSKREAAKHFGVSSSAVATWVDRGLDGWAVLSGSRLSLTDAQRTRFKEAHKKRAQNSPSFQFEALRKGAKAAAKLGGQARKKGAYGIRTPAGDFANAHVAADALGIALNTVYQRVWKKVEGWAYL